MVNVILNGVKIKRYINLLKPRDDGFYGYVSFKNKKVKVRKDRGKGNKVWTLA